jgi:Penicillin binding protein transpeptidase domain
VESDRPDSPTITLEPYDPEYRQPLRPDRHSLRFGLYPAGGADAEVRHLDGAGPELDAVGQLHYYLDGATQVDDVDHATPTEVDSRPVGARSRRCWADTECFGRHLPQEASAGRQICSEAHRDRATRDTRSSVPAGEQHAGAIGHTLEEVVDAEQATDLGRSGTLVHVAAAPGLEHPTVAHDHDLVGQHRRERPGQTDSNPILEGLEGVIDNRSGTGYAAFQEDADFSLSNFRIAGKTGTADISAGGTKEPDAWFVAFGPIPNPKYVVVVAVGEGGYSADAAAPAVIKIFNYLVAHPIGAVTLPTTQSTTTSAPTAATTTTVPSTTSTTAP